MPYSSPLHILPPEELASSEATGDAFLLRLRKKLLAEYQLTNEPELIINGKAYTRDTIIKTIDVLLGNPDLPLHIYIFKDPALLGFLEGKNNRFNYAALAESQPPEELLPAIHNLLIEQALFVFKRSMQAGDFGEAQVMITFLKQLPGYQTDDYYHVIYNSLENIRGLIRSERESELRESAKTLGFMKNHAFSTVLNALAADFIDTINTLVADIINFMVAYQKAPKADKGFLYIISTMLTKVSCDTELETLIAKNHKVFSANYLGNTTTGGGGGTPTSRVLYIIIMVVVFGARIFYTCDRSSSSSASFNPSYYSSPSLQAREPSLDDKLKEMRKHCLYKAQRDVMGSLYAPADSSLLQGNNPFTFLANADDTSLPNDSIVSLNLVNHTGYDLVLIRHQGSFVHSTYVFNDSTLHYEYPKGYFLSVYAGNKWMKLIDGSALGSIGFGDLKYGYDNKFKDGPPNAESLFATDYTISVLDHSKKKKKKPLTAELTGAFIQTGDFENKSLQFIRIPLQVEIRNTASLP